MSHSPVGPPCRLNNGWEAAPLRTGRDLQVTDCRRSVQPGFNRNIPSYYCFCMCPTVHQKWGGSLLRIALSPTITLPVGSAPHLTIDTPRGHTSCIDHEAVTTELLKKQTNKNVEKPKRASILVQMKGHWHGIMLYAWQAFPSSLCGFLACWPNFVDNNKLTRLISLPAFAMRKKKKKTSHVLPN